MCNDQNRQIKLSRPIDDNDDNLPNYCLISLDTGQRRIVSEFVLQKSSNLSILKNTLA